MALVNWLVPTNFQALVGVAYDRLFHGPFRNNLALKDRHKGKRCFVVGNGPSLASVDLSILRNQITIGANSIYKHRDAEQLDLKYLCIGDPHFMVDRAENVTWHKILCEKLPRAEFVLHHDGAPLIERHALYSGRKIFFVRTGVRSSNTLFANIDFTRALNLGATTGTTLAIPLALYMGCAEIILLGFDANWLDDYESSYHFYDAHEQYPEFDSVSSDGRGHSYLSELEQVALEFRSHHLLQSIALKRGVRLLNATLGGRLDMHPRVDLQEYT